MATAATTTASHTCCFRSCRNKAIDADHDAWLRVRLDIHNGTTAQDRRQWPIEVHDQTGVATLHQTCWDFVCTEHGRLIKRQTSKLGKLLRESSETAEFFDGHANVRQKAVQLAQILREAQHAVAFTGAGISTSAGIGDFRGLFGQWTEGDLTQAATKSGDDYDDVDDDVGVPYEDLRPTLAHEALYWLMERGMLKHVITQNCDGLHRLSGISGDHVSELHGNVFIEYCRTCQTEFERPKCVSDDDASLYYEEMEEHGFSYMRKPKAAQCPQCRLTHQTKRKCPTCRKPLHDTIINFGDDLRESQFGPALEHSKAADVMLVLGSTLRVTPASDLCKPTTSRRRRTNPIRLAICNRQETEHDDLASLRIHGDCDELMAGVLKELMGGEEAYQEWLDKRAERLATYDKKKKKR